MKKLYYISYLVFICFAYADGMEKPSRSNNHLEKLRQALDTRNIEKIKKVWQQYFALMPVLYKYTVLQSVKNEIDSLCSQDEDMDGALREIFPVIFMSNGQFLQNIIASSVHDDESISDDESIGISQASNQEGVFTPLHFIVHKIAGDHENEHGFLFELQHNNTQIVLALVVTACAAIVGGTKLYTRYYAWQKENDQKHLVLDEQNIKITSKQRRISNGIPEFANFHVRQILKKLKESKVQTRGIELWSQQRRRLNFQSRRALAR
jgi:hypothetical protein